jgi:DNA-binding NarL/FixJ family response regulator
MLINKSFFEILKSVIYVTILKTDEQESCLNILKTYINSTKIGKKKNKKYIRSHDDFYYNKLLNIFEAKNRINLYFILLSKSPAYINCNKLTVLENKYLELVFLGYSKVEISKIFKKQNVTIYKRLDAIYDKLCVKDINEALIKILKENNLYKDISEIITDSEKYSIDFK